MANNFEFRDSCATGLYPYFAGTQGTGNTGRGGGRGYDVNGSRLKYAVSPEGDKVAAQAWKISSLVFPKHMTFAESGTAHISIVSNTLGKLELRRGDYNGTLIATSTTQVLFIGDYPHVECKCTVHDTLGSVAVRVNEVDVVWDAAVTNIDTRNGGTGVINEIWFGDPIDHDNFCDINSQFSGSDWAGDVRVLYRGATTAGTYTDGVATGAATRLECVDETTGHNDDTDYVLQDSTSLPKAVSMGVAALPSNVTAVLDVAPVCVSRKDDAGVDTVRGLLISGATEDDGGADVAAIATYTDIFGLGAGKRHYQNDPNTSAPWTVSGANAIEVGRRRVA